MRLSSLSFLFLLGIPLSAYAAPILEITGGKTDQDNVVVRYPLSGESGTGCTEVVLPDSKSLPAQVVGPALGDNPAAKHNLVFVLPKLKAGETVRVLGRAEPNSSSRPQFQFIEKKEQPLELVFGPENQRRPVLQFFNLPHSAADHYYTFKPFHNLYDPETGKTMLTNTSAKTPKDGQFPHHRGLFFGFNRISYGDKQDADIWHGHNNVYSEGDKLLSTEAGEAVGRHRSAISWHGKDGKAFANEEREVTVYAVAGGTLLDWSTVLTTTLDKVRLDGDPQHAGFHFRANMEVSKNGKQNTYYLRPDGKGKIGETRNWDAKGKDARTINLPWNACSFVVGDKRFTVLRINHPDNPKETRGSERDYGRFGDYFEYDLSASKPLKLRYRVWLQAGEMTVEQCQAMASAFVDGVTIQSKR